MSERKAERLKSLLLSTPTVAGYLLTAQEVEQLVQYYALVLKWTPQLHLTTMVEPEEFFQRHIFEAVFLTQHIVPSVTGVWDLGSGLGIPGIPLAILRPELSVHLVEANHRKAVFLDEVAFAVKLQNLKVLNLRLESLSFLPDSAVLVVRAVEKMASLLPVLLELGKNCPQILLLGGAELVKELGQLSFNLEMEALLLPGSQRRFLINLIRST
jgi:16S rRNA (guanine527-N7)-methyltransferase